MNIPIIDLEEFSKCEKKEKAASNLRNVCKNIGFFYVKNHMVPQDLEDQLLVSAKDFFALPQEEKRKIHMKRGKRAWRGYFGVGE
jgi:isopenicillin N synthase-like dioxygenase